VGHTVEFGMLKLVVHIATTGPIKDYFAISALLWRDSYTGSAVKLVLNGKLTFQRLRLTMKKKREREVGSSERHYGWGEQNISSVLKVPRYCPFVLLVMVSF
jgi:hypothetical protein